MMSKEKLILDIRYYESDSENIAGLSLPSEPGRLFQFPKSIKPLGERIARKLREFQFLTYSFDHVYINFTTVLPEGSLRPSPRECDSWFKYFDYGADPQRINNLLDSEKVAFVERATYEVLRFHASDNAKQIKLIDRVQKEIEARGSELEITHKVKETKFYTITVSYQIRPNGNASIGLIELLDKKTGDTFKREFMELKHYEDIFALVSTISVSHGMIRLKPRTSFKANLYTERYKVPIEISLASMSH